jgi:hypothetical protein
MEASWSGGENDNNILEILTIHALLVNIVPISVFYSASRHLELVIPVNLIDFRVGKTISKEVRIVLKGLVA